MRQQQQRQQQQQQRQQTSRAKIKSILFKLRLNKETITSKRKGIEITIRVTKGLREVIKLRLQKVR